MLSTDKIGTGWRAMLIGVTVCAAAFGPVSVTAQVPMVLIEWSFDVEHGLIQMRFSKNVDPSSVQLSGITMDRNPNSNRDPFFSFTCGDVHVGETEIWIRLCQADLDTIDLLAPLAKAHDKTYITLTVNTVRDVNGEANIPTAGMQVCH